MRGSRVLGRALCALMVCAALGGTAAPGAAAESAAVPVGQTDITGTWTGSKLRCQKEEGKLVRCGTPSPFSITFVGDGSGSSPDDTFPRAFTWRWISPTEIGVTTEGAKDELRLFGLERDDAMMTFQAYVFLPTADPNQPAEVRYIHFVFDINRTP